MRIESKALDGQTTSRLISYDHFLKMSSQGTQFLIILHSMNQFVEMNCIFSRNNFACNVGLLFLRCHRKSRWAKIGWNIKGTIKSKTIGLNTARHNTNTFGRYVQAQIQSVIFITWLIYANTESKLTDVYVGSGKESLQLVSHKSWLRGRPQSIFN